MSTADVIVLAIPFAAFAVPALLLVVDHFLDWRDRRKLRTHIWSKWSTDVCLCDRCENIRRIERELGIR